MSSWIKPVVTTAIGLVLLTEAVVFAYFWFTFEPRPGDQYPPVVHALAALVALNFAWPFFLPFVLLCSIAFALSAVVWSVVYMLGKRKR